MRLSGLILLPLSLVAAGAFKDTSPFILFSTSELLASSPQFVSAEELTDNIGTVLEFCPSDVYVVVSQPGVTSDDYSSKAFAPRLKSLVSGAEKQIRSSLTVSNVVGQVDRSKLKSVLLEKCGAEPLNVDAATSMFDIVDDMKPRLVTVDFPPLPAGEARSSASRTNDLFLSNLLSSLPSSEYTVIYTTTPPSADETLDMPEPDAYHMKTPLSPLTHVELSSTNDPLFERYQFFTPGLFMGLLVAIILITILYLGISGLASLKVSYAAFDKEAGPAMQKKN